MRILPLLFLITFIVFTSTAQQVTPSQVPDAVIKIFKATFPDAVGVKWEKKKEAFKAAFKVGKEDHDVWMTNEGTIKKHREEIQKDNLPQAINATIKRDFSAYKIGACEKTKEQDALTYKVTLKSEAGKKNVHFDQSGKVIDKKADK